MKTYWSAFLSLLFFTMLTGCGNEQFGTGGKSSESVANPLTSFSYQACTSYTLIKPKVDVLYVVDNSGSSGYIPSELKSSIASTVNSLSKEFDFRVVGTSLVSTSLTDYNVITNSTDLVGINPAKIISSPGQFGFFTQGSSQGGYEQGLTRVYNYLNQYKGTLFRQNSHLIVVLVSNGLDADIEYPAVQYGQGINSPILMKSDGAAKFAVLQNNLLSIKNYLQSSQLRFISATAHTSCQSGWWASQNSYVAMSRKLYELSGSSDQGGDPAPDAYDLCASGVNQLFSSLNSAIQQVTIPHQYKYWPITFADNNSSTVSFDDIKVTKISPSNSKVELVKGVDWNLKDFGSITSVNTRVLPSAGESVSGRYFVEFVNNLVYPNCVLVTSVSQTETFNWVVLPQNPVFPVKVFVNGVEIPQSALGTSVSGFKTDNIKFSPASTPPVMKSGFFLEITNSAYFYKSGDGVSTQYTPAGI